MRVIRPVEITDAVLNASNIPEDDHPQWSASASYDAGERVIILSSHRIYESLIDGNNADPRNGVFADPQTWLDVGATNRWKMFDGLLSDQSVASEEISIVLHPNAVTTAISAFNVTAREAIVTITDDTDGEVYNRTVELIDNSGVTDWFEYFFEPIIRSNEFVLLDLPAYTTGEIRVRFLNDDNVDVKVGQVVIGSQIELGVANHGTGLRLMDFSVRERDEFGNFIIVPRLTSKLVDFDVTIETSRVGYVFSQVERLTNQAVVWVGTDSDDDATLIYGYYRDMQINITYPTISDCTIQVEGLI